VTNKKLLQDRPTEGRRQKVRGGLLLDGGWAEAAAGEQGGGPVRRGAGEQGGRPASMEVGSQGRRARGGSRLGGAVAGEAGASRVAAGHASY
jgi:hypothetical protein